MSGVLRGLARALQKPRVRYPLLVAWLGFLVATGISAPTFLDKTSQDFTPPPDTLAAKATEAMRQYFPDNARSSQFVILLQSNQNIIQQNSTSVFTRALFTRLATQKNLIASNVSYFSLLDQGFDPSFLNQSFVSPSGQATFIQITVTSYITDSVTFDFMDWLQAELPALQPPDLAVSVLGAPLVIRNAISAAEGDLAKMDAIVLPLAFLILAVLLRSWRLIILPVITLGASLAASFGTVAWIAGVVPIYITTPSLMMSILIAMAIDYALFLLTRFKEELQRGLTVQMACEEMMATAGMTITTSGFTLQAAFLSLLFVPLTIVSTLGLGCAISLMMTLLVNLTLLPALLLTFPSFFGHMPSNTGQSVLEEPLTQFLQVEKVSPTGVWGRIAFLTTHPYLAFAVVIVMSGMVVPVAWMIFDLKSTDSFQVEIARGSPLLQAMNDMTTQFGGGFLTPYTLLITPRNASISVMSKEFFQVAGAAVNLISQQPLFETSVTDFNSAVFAQGMPVPWIVVEGCQNVSIKDPYCVGVRFACSSFINPSHSAAVVLITLGWDALNENGPLWLEQMRAAMAIAEEKYELNFWLSGVAADSLDGIKEVYAVLPLMIGLTCGCVLLIMGVAFRAPIVPIRAVFSIALTLGWVYGLCVWVYVKGGLDFLGFNGLKGEGALEWIIPIVSFPIIVGISLDYDIFLLARIVELRDEGLSDAEAIQQGLCKTGHIITTAGVIMAIAFSGLMFSTLPSCNQLSFVMVVAVTFDTFGVRTFLEPAMMSILGRAHWWPRKRKVEPFAYEG